MWVCCEKARRLHSLTMWLSLRWTHRHGWTHVSLALVKLCLLGFMTLWTPCRKRHSTLFPHLGRQRTAVLMTHSETEASISSEVERSLAYYPVCHLHLSKEPHSANSAFSLHFVSSPARLPSSKPKKIHFKQALWARNPIGLAAP
uniref:Uncharacterized protein n=1 Tax=Rousettus aegyptiacus TaxID=9407 RepID=A0A7J8FJB8_ROUAE|nr:hypothetical protein HJG63_012171 [Rousettus aegyptiacus]